SPAEADGAPRRRRRRLPRRAPRARDDERGGCRDPRDGAPLGREGDARQDEERLRPARARRRPEGRLEAAGAPRRRQGRTLRHRPGASRDARAGEGRGPPRGRLFDVRTIYDASLLEVDSVNFNAGTKTDSVAMARDDLIRIGGGEVAAFSSA